MKTKLSVLSIFLTLLITTCSGYNGDEAVLVMNLGGSGTPSLTPLMHWPPADATELGSLTYDIVLTGPSGRIESKDTTSASGAVTITVIPGSWTIEITAYSAGELYAYYITTVTLRAGQNNIPILLQRAGQYAIKMVVTPPVTSVLIGESETFGGETKYGGRVAGGDMIHKYHKWTVSGNTSSATFIAGTSISDDLSTGLLTVGPDETATKLTVKVESTISSSIYTIADVAVRMYAARVSVNGNDTLYKKLKDAFDSVQDNQTATITLLENISSQEPIPISGTNKVITLISDVGGKRIQLGSSGSLFTINSGVTLKIGGPASDELILRGKNSNSGNIIGVGPGGTFIMDSGTIEGNISGQPYLSGGGVGVYGGNFIMNNGTIQLNDVAFIGGDGGNGGGVCVVSGGTFTMNNGIIQGNASRHGGGVFVDSVGIFNMYGGTIGGGNIATGQSDSGGGGVCTYARDGGGTFNMYGGTITGNSAPNRGGGGVYIEGRFYMMGGSIYGNSAASTRGNSLYVNLSGVAKYDSGSGANIPMTPYPTASPLWYYLDTPLSR